MAGMAGNSARGGFTAGALLAGAVGVLALPSAVLAFTSRFEPAPHTGTGGEGAEDYPAPRIAAQLTRSLGKGQMFRFTPAGTENRPDRSVTVAVRVDALAAQAISGRSVRIAAAQTAPGIAPLQIAPTKFSLGVSRGYRNFGQEAASAAELRGVEMPDLASFKSGSGAKGDPSRFSPRIVIEDKPAAGRAPRTFSDSDDSVDLGGAYRVTGNLNVTAGVRYSQERDRLAPLTDRKKDSQAVYVGTQFRF